MKKFLFTPFMMNLGESQRLSQIASTLHQAGHEIHILGDVFYPFLFQHDAYIFHQCPFDTQVYCRERYQEFFSFDMDFNFLTDEEIRNMCNYERELLVSQQFDAVFTGYRLSIVVSCKIEQIPLVWIISGSVQIDEIIHNIDGIIPDYISFDKKNEKAKKSIKRLVLSYSKSIESWNKYLLSEGGTPMKSGLELFIGNLNLIADYSKFYTFDSETNYKIVGPILFSSKKSGFRQLKGKNRILLSFGTSFNKEWVIDFVSHLPEGPSYILTTCGEEFYIGRKDIELVDFIDFDSLKAKISFAIIHGGQGTVYAMAQQGIPFIGIPFFNEQLWNIKKFSNYGAAMLLSKEEKISEKMSMFQSEIEAYSEKMSEISRGIFEESQHSLTKVSEILESFLE
ncbi:glycosyltransferase [Lactococcus ileimucosae]|uniref:glycosyltransferase n=1 Tax=Lactococcus ileimucosae TaxID=2941329 RepID=UPI0020447662|nr:nucleotide disphospho-sugar-binding domain-containing protein [Lactococcus ileimucosae]